MGLDRIEAGLDKITKERLKATVGFLSPLPDLHPLMQTMYHIFFGIPFNQLGSTDYAKKLPSLTSVHVKNWLNTIPVYLMAFAVSNGNQ